MATGDVVTEISRVNFTRRYDDGSTTRTLPPAQETNKRLTVRGSGQPSTACKLEEVTLEIEQVGQ